MAATGSRIVVPEQFAQWRARLDGDGGRDWVASLPARAERLAAQWRLTLDDAEPLHGAQALVVRVTRDGRPLVLKLSAPQDRTTAAEATGLRAWRGRGVVELLESEPGALLLERLDHTRTLLEIVTEVAALDRDLARGWVITRCVDYHLWGLERGLTVDPARCERVLSALLPA